MLDRFERDKLREIEHQISAADPELAAFLRGAQGRLPRPLSAAADTVRRIGHIASPSERRVQTVECGSASRRA
jgi:hypothetical protein